MKKLIDPPALTRNADIRAELVPKIRATYRRTEEDRRQLGIWLLQCKEACLHAGEPWLQWLERETGMSHDTATRCMNAVENKGQDKSSNTKSRNDGQTESEIKGEQQEQSSSPEEAERSTNSQPVQPPPVLATQAEPPEPEILCDEADQELPEQAYPAFNQLPNLRDILARCDKLARDVEALASEPIGRCLHAQSAAAQIRAAKKTLKAGRPAMVCPYCRGDRSDCKACDGTGWVTETTWKQSPPEKQEIIRARESK